MMRRVGEYQTIKQITKRKVSKKLDKELLYYIILVTYNYRLLILLFFNNIQLL